MSSFVHKEDRVTYRFIHYLLTTKSQLSCLHSHNICMWPSHAFSGTWYLVWYQVPGLVRGLAGIEIRPSTGRELYIYARVYSDTQEYYRVPDTPSV